MAEPELATAVRDEGSVLHEAGGCSARRIGWSGNSDGQAEGWRRWEGPGPKAQTANYQLAPEHRSYHGLPRSLLLPPTQGDSHSSLKLWSFWGAMSAVASCEPTSCCQAEWSQGAGWRGTYCAHQQAVSRTGLGLTRQLVISFQESQG